MPATQSQGQIVWVTIPDTRGGNAKARPAVILTATREIPIASEIQVAAVTTLTGQAPFSETVELPSDPAGHPQTKLKRPCEVVCTWLASVPVSAVSATAGVVPSDMLAEILAKVQRLN